MGRRAGPPTAAMRAGPSDTFDSWRYSSPRDFLIRSQVSATGMRLARLSRFRPAPMGCRRRPPGARLARRSRRPPPRSATVKDRYRYERRESPAAADDECDLLESLRKSLEDSPDRNWPKLASRAPQRARLARGRVGGLVAEDVPGLAVQVLADLLERLEAHAL